MNSTTSCPQLDIIVFSDSRLIKLAPLNEWLWSYIPPKWTRMDIERYGYPIPSSSGLQWCLHWSCSDKASKMVNLISLDWDIHFIKPLIFFIYSLFKPSQWVLIKGWPHFSQDVKAKNKLISLQVWKKPPKSPKTKFVAISPM
jgi:hypothetical protein